MDNSEKLPVMYQMALAKIGALTLECDVRSSDAESLRLQIAGLEQKVADLESELEDEYEERQGFDSDDDDDEDGEVGSVHILHEGAEDQGDESEEESSSEHQTSAD